MYSTVKSLDIWLHWEKFKTKVSCEAEKKQAICDEQMSYLQIVPL